MKDIARLFKNIASLSMREAVNKGALLVMLFFIARLLGKAQLGQYTLALTISQILFFATDLGLNTLLVREVARDRSAAPKCMLNFGITNGILSTLSLLLIGVATWALRCPKTLTCIIFLCALSYFVIRFIVFFESVFQAFEKMEYQFFASLFKNLVFIPLGIWHLVKGGGLVGLFSIFLITNAITLIAVGFACIRMVRFAFRPLDAAFLKTYILKTIPIWLTQLFALLYLKMASLFLYKFKGEEAVGVYNAAYILVDGFLIFSGVIAAALLPIFSRKYALSIENLTSAYQKSFNLVSFLFLPLAICAALLADRFVLLFYGQGYEGTVVTIRLLSFTAFLVVFGGLHSFLTITIDKQKILPLICGFGVPLNILLNISLIPRFSYIGAALSSVITEAVMFSVLFFMIRKYFYKAKLGRIFFKTVIAAVVTGAVVYLLRPINLILLLGIAIAVYLSFTYALKGFLFQERGYIKNIIHPGIKA